MKKILFFLSLFLMFGISVNAQKKCTKGEKSCAKKCSKAKADSSADASTATTAVAAAYMEAADKAAESDDSVEKKTCPHSGTAYYYKKGTDSKTGEETLNEVEYDADAKAFVSVSSTEVMSSSMEKVAGGNKCEPGCKKACCKDGKKACAKGDKKACAKGCKKACCKDGKKACAKGDKKACAKKCTKKDSKDSDIKEEKEEKEKK